MIERLEPITTFSLEHPDFSESDRLAEVGRYLSRQRAIARCLDGQESPDVVLDMLEEHGIDPVQYVADVADSVELIILQQLPVQLWA